jgi:1A family penicillin-binding protein
MSRKRQPLIIVAWAVLIVCGLAAGLAVHRLWQFRSELERLADRISLDAGPESTLLYDSNNNLVGAVYEQHRIGVRLEEMSPHLTDAVLVTEDRRFFDHGGVDGRRIVAAFLANLRAGTIVEGGSTITQQLVRSLALDRDRTYRRKIIEALLALRLEERYSKHAILEAYLNRVYFGDGYYGVEAASLGYFGKPSSQLTAEEAATLAGVIKGPSIYAPTKNPGACKERRDVVLQLMHDDRLITDEEYERAKSRPVTALLASARENNVADPRHAHGAEYFRDAVTRELVARFGEEVVYTAGLRVYTTLDPDLQQLAENVIATRVSGLSSGPEPLQGALVAVDPKTGYVKAIVGGRSFQETPFNRAIDARRQPGSTFKPFIYAAALESGFSPNSQLDGLDEPIETKQGPWLPSGEHESNITSLRTALAVSSNRAAAHLLQQVGIQRTLDLAQRMGITSPLPAVPALALGTGEVSLYELTSAYGVFANRGVWKPPTMIRRVLDRDGREIYVAADEDRRVLSEGTAYMMSSMMSDVLKYGTAANARSQGFTLHAAGKTGTSQEYTDAWFVGFTRNLVTGVWFGFDKPRPIMTRGFASVVAVPAWVRFMSAAMRGAKDDWFDMPGSLVKVKICRLSGMLATDHCNEPVYEPAPYDPNHPDVVPVSGNVRPGDVYEEVMSADRVPPPCTLPHGVAVETPSYPPPYGTSYSTTSSSATSDPRSGANAGQHAATMGVTTPSPAMPAPAIPAPAIPARLSPPVEGARSTPFYSNRPPVAAPPAWMTARPAPSRVISLPPAAERFDMTPTVVTPAAPARSNALPTEQKPKSDVAPKVEQKPSTEDPLKPIIPGAPAPKPPASPDGPIVPGSRLEQTAPPPPPRPPEGLR